LVHLKSAFVILREGIHPTEKLATAIFNFCEGKLAKYKIPRIIEFKEELPKTISGKIRRIELRAEEATLRINKGKGEYEFFHDKY